MSANRVQKKSQQRSSTVRRHNIAAFTDRFGLTMPVDCSRCKRLRLPDCKAADRSSSCQHCLKAGRSSSCNILGDPQSVIQGILDEKRRLDREREATISKLLEAAAAQKEATAKLARLEIQSRALEGKAEDAFLREATLLREQEAEECAESSGVTQGAGFPASEGDHFPSSVGDVGNLDWASSANVDWSVVDPDLLAQVGLGSVGGTAGASPGSPGNRQVPTN